MSQSKHHHEEIYRGADFIKKLAAHRITVCGAGALGSLLIDDLARIGFPNLRVIDFDRVENHNVSTQIFGEMDIGMLKSDALKNRIFRHVGTEIDAINKRLAADNAGKFLKNSTLVVDAFDNSASRKLVQDECRAKKIPCLHSGLYEDFGQISWDVSYKIPKDAEGDVCDYPLARNLILLVVAVTAEEILDFCLSAKPRLANWTVTLKDLAVKRNFV